MNFIPALFRLLFFPTPPAALALYNALADNYTPAERLAEQAADDTNYNEHSAAGAFWSGAETYKDAAGNWRDVRDVT